MRTKRHKRTTARKREYYPLTAGDIYLITIALDGAKLSDQGKEMLAQLRIKLDTYLRKKLKM